MNFVQCNACPSHADCVEAGKCLNTLVTHRHGLRPLAPGTYTATVGAVQQRPDGKVEVTISVPGAKPVRSVMNPGQGTVTDRIFAECDSCLRELRHGMEDGKRLDPKLLAEARKLAIPRLEAAGVNGNSARKGSSMWVAARQ